MKIAGMRTLGSEDGGYPEESGMVLSVCLEAGYTFACRDGSLALHDHTPCDALYQLYLSKAHQFRHRFLETPPLNRTEFGVALSVACDGQLTKRQIRIDGQRITAYSGVKGPKSFYRRLSVGRPPRND